MIRFCITGSGRSTTMWTADVLTAAGLTCYHETICSSWTDEYDDDGLWRTADPVGESSAQAAPFTSAMRAEGVVVVHLIRHPLEVAASIMAKGMLHGDLPFHRFVSKHLGEYHSAVLWRLEPLDRALYFWVVWNRLVEADLRWSAPVTGSEIMDLAALLGEPVLPLAPALERPPLNGGRRGETPTWSDFTPSIRRLALDQWALYGAG